VLFRVHFRFLLIEWILGGQAFSQR
jgi:hypothetical protein